MHGNERRLPGGREEHGGVSGGRRLVRRGRGLRRDERRLSARRLRAQLARLPRLGGRLRRRRELHGDERGLSAGREEHGRMPRGRRRLRPRRDLRRRERRLPARRLQPGRRRVPRLAGSVRPGGVLHRHRPGLPTRCEEHGRVPRLRRGVRHPRDVRRDQRRLPAGRVQPGGRRVPRLRGRVRSRRELHRNGSRLPAGCEEHGGLPAVAGRLRRRGAV